MLLAADSVDNVILNTKVKFYSKVENKGVNAKVEQEVNKKKIKTNMKEKSEKGIMTEEMTCSYSCCCCILVVS